MKSFGRQQAALRMVPAQQRLEAGEPLLAEIDDRLIEQFEVALGERAAQRQIERAARLGDRVHVRMKQPVLSAPGRLGAIHRKIGRASSAWSGRPARRSASAMPMLAPTNTWWPSTTWHSLMASITRRASAIEVACTSRERWRMANSSPPNRATKSSAPQRVADAVGDFLQQARRRPNGRACR